VPSTQHKPLSPFYAELYSTRAFFSKRVSKNTIKRGIREVESGNVYVPGERIRAQGGGRKKINDTDQSLISV